MRAIQLTPERVPAFAIAEIAFLVTLTSAERTASATAAQCLRLLAGAERQKGNAPTHLISEEERSKRYPVYEQLGDPKALVLGASWLSYGPGRLSDVAAQVVWLTRSVSGSSCVSWLSPLRRISRCGRNATGGGVRSRRCLGGTRWIR